MKKIFNVLSVFTYLLGFLIAICYFAIYIKTQRVIPEEWELFIYCILTGGVGGCLYCLRGIYLNYCVRDQWENKWIPWYIIRPIVSLICGGTSYLFLQAGLLVLEAKEEQSATNLGYYSLAFIAGMNVDKFIAKIEDIAQTVWGIDKSRANGIKQQVQTNLTIEQTN